MMMPNWMAVTTSVLAAMLISAEPASQPAADSRPTEAFPLWANGAPLAHGTDPDKDVPTLTPFWPAQQPSGAAMIICPGGGYAHLASYEGKDYAEFLAQHGIAGFVLKYRLGSNGYRHPAMMFDVQRAIRYVRANAAAWGIDPHRIGVMGSSAGGHLASVAATHFDAGNPAAADPIDQVSCRPDVAVLIYPVISMGPNTHLGSLHNLLGDHPDPALVTFLSSELQVTPQTPPCFLFHRFEDKTVKLEGVLDFAAALRKNGVPFDLHVFEEGGHGGGLGGPVTVDDSQLHPWTRDLLFWLRAQKMID
jgi:acetyl esterase/lipase